MERFTKKTSSRLLRKKVLTFKWLKWLSRQCLLFFIHMHTHTIFFFFGGVWMAMAHGDLNPCLLHWKHRVLPTGPPGKLRKVFSERTWAQLLGVWRFQEGHAYALFPDLKGLSQLLALVLAAMVGVLLLGCAWCSCPSPGVVRETTSVPSLNSQK